MVGKSGSVFLGLCVFAVFANFACADELEPRSQSRARVGGWKDANINDSYVKEIAQFAFERLEKGCNCLYRNKVLKVAKARQQVVSGLKTEVTLHLVPTNCRQGTTSNIEDCKAVSDEPNKVCVVQVWDRPWLNKRKVLMQKCEVVEKNGNDVSNSIPSDVTESLVGGGGHDGTTKNLIGGGDHDYVPHGVTDNMIGGGGHDGTTSKPNIGGDDHDYVPHGGNTPLIGGGDHDYRPHGGSRPMIGGGGHDGEKAPLIGGGDHDYVPHGDNRPLIGGGGHDGEKAPLIGGGDHDYVPHGDNRPLIGGGGHDGEKAPLIGGGDHDYVPHGDNRPLIGGGGHDGEKAPLIGGGDHDYVPHGQGEQQIGGGDHDFTHLGMFKEFTMKYNKTYQTQKEYDYRFGVFRENMKKVKKLQETEQGTAVYGPTYFADFTEKEFKTYFTGLRPDLQKDSDNMQRARIPNIKLPQAFDWRQQKVVTEVKNQGMCGSCWAFSTTGNVEGQWAIQERQLVSLSEQELVDCDKLDEGCNGGLMTNAYEQIIKLGGLEGETDYPYEGHNDKCQMKKSLVKVNIKSYVNISTDETEMAQWLVKNGPMSIGINANAMQFYFGGVSHPFKFLCSPGNLDHGVLIVGFGEAKNQYFNKTLPYWIIKNSWGPHWGEQGYYRVYRGDGTCGVNLMATSAVVG